MKYFHWQQGLQREKENAGVTTTVCDLCFKRSTQVAWGSKERHQVYALGYSWPICRANQPKSSPSLVKQNPCKWAQLPQLPQGCPFSGMMSSHSVLFQPKSASMSSKQPCSFNSWYQCTHCTFTCTFTAGDFWEPVLCYSD